MGTSGRTWRVVALAVAKKEGHRILNPLAYEHMVEVVKRLSHWSDKQEIADLRLEEISGELWELKDKGGPLHRINLRVYFAVLDQHLEIVLLKTYKKDAEHAAPHHVLEIAADRLEAYKHGRLADGQSVYPHGHSEPVGAPA